MKDRTFTLLGALISVLVIITVLFPSRVSGPGRHPRPTSEERSAVGLRGLKSWLERSNVPTRSLRRRYQALLTDPDLPDSGNLIVINEPAVTVPSRAELDTLATWIRQGNYALILVAMHDLPDWVKALHHHGHDVLGVFGMRLATTKQPEDADTAGKHTQSAAAISGAVAALSGKDRQPSTLVPALDYPLLQGVKSVSSYRSVLFDQQSVEPRSKTSSRYFLPLLARSDGPGYAFWAFRSGAGGGWISSQPDMFGNATLGHADNARLFANILAAALGPDGFVVFDDMHLGLSDLYDPANFFRDSRLHNTLWFLALLWLVFMLGYSNRLAPVRTSVRTARAADFVEAMAGYFARKMAPVSVGRRLLNRFYEELRHFYRQTNADTAIIPLLRSKASISGKDIQSLELLAQKLADNRPVNLTQLTRVIDRIKGSMQ